MSAILQKCGMQHAMETGRSSAYLGVVHITLSNINETFSDWFPLESRDQAAGYENLNIIDLACSPYQ